MRPLVEYSEQAATDLDEITEYFLYLVDQGTIDEDTAIKAMSAISADILYLAETATLGRRIATLAPQYRVWPIFRNRYKLYFERLGPDHIKVIRVYGSARRPLKLGELIPDLPEEELDREEKARSQPPAPSPGAALTRTRRYILDRSEPASLEYRMVMGERPLIVQITDRLEEIKKTFDLPSDYKKIVSKWLRAQRELREAEGDI